MPQDEGCVVPGCVGAGVRACCPVHAPEAVVERVRTSVLERFSTLLAQWEHRPRTVARLLTLRDELLKDLANTL